ncbi:MAG: hypothetical protein ACYDDS_13365 [Candidatus Sulfotelmatobacter sp.]
MTVLMQCLFAVCVLAVVTVGLLVMMRAISLEELGDGIGRCFLMVLSVLIALSLLKKFLLPILISWLVTLKQMTWWIVIIVLAIIAAILLLRTLVSNFQKWLSAHGNHDGGEL